MDGPYCLLEDGDSESALEDSAAVWRFVADAVRRLPKLRVIRTSDTEVWPLYCIGTPVVSQMAII